jgi:hypothetical protein
MAGDAGRGPAPMANCGAAPPQLRPEDVSLNISAGTREHEPDGAPKAHVNQVGHFDRSNSLLRFIQTQAPQFC